MLSNILFIIGTVCLVAGDAYLLVSFAKDKKEHMLTARFPLFVGACLVVLSTLLRLY